MSEREYITRSIDYLGNLGSRLRDLQGYDTLAYELIQNADDAEGANEMIFDVREDSVVVDNNGVFADCGQPENEHCPWTDKSDLKHKCDYGTVGDMMKDSCALGTVRSITKPNVECEHATGKFILKRGCEYRTG